MEVVIIFSYFVLRSPRESCNKKYHQFVRLLYTLFAKRLYSLTTIIGDLVQRSRPLRNELFYQEKIYILEVAYKFHYHYIFLLNLRGRFHLVLRASECEFSYQDNMIRQGVRQNFSRAPVFLLHLRTRCQDSITV